MGMGISLHSEKIGMWLYSDMIKKEFRFHSDKNVIGMSANSASALPQFYCFSVLTNRNLTAFRFWPKCKWNSNTEFYQSIFPTRIFSPASDRLLCTQNLLLSLSWFMSYCKKQISIMIRVSNSRLIKTFQKTFKNSPNSKKFEFLRQNQHDLHF